MARAGGAFFPEEMPPVFRGPIPSGCRAWSGWNRAADFHWGARRGYAIRQQLAPRGIHVASLHVGYMDTDMVAQIDSPKGDPAVIAALALDGVQAGAFEVVADEKGKMVRSLLSA